MNPFLLRCLELAHRAPPTVGVNPPVGALLVESERILSEGWHERPGGPHAEVAALDALPPLLRDRIPTSTLYVSLEPCCHTGKRTPPCTDRLIAEGIGRVMVGCLDPNPQVAGRGIATLRQAGITVELAPDPLPFEALIRPFARSIRRRRPYVILKWAETADGKIGRSTGERLLISGSEALRYVHQLRSRCQAIMVGKNTVRRDNPLLSVRHAPGQPPVRILFDIDLDLDPALAIFRPDAPVIVINHQRDETQGHLRYFVPQNKTAYVKLDILLGELYERCGIGTLLVEGGRYLLQQFLNQGVFDELHILRGPLRAPVADVAAPRLTEDLHLDRVVPLGADLLFMYHPPHPNR